MDKFDQWRAQLAEFEGYRQNEIKWGPIEKWLTEEFGAVRLPGRGSHVVFEHPDFKRLHYPGHFQAALKKNKTIYRSNLKQLCRRLRAIIDLLEVEVRRGR